MLVNRRHILRSASLSAPALLLAGCSVFSKTTATVGGVTTSTITIDLTKLAQYATALQNGVSTLLTIPAIPAALGPVATAAVSVAVKDLATQVAALAAADSGSTTLVYTTSTVPAALQAFQTDATSVAKNTALVLAGILPSVSQQVSTYIDAFNTIVSLAETVLPSSTATPAAAAPPTMTEAQALKVLGVVS